MVQSANRLFLLVSVCAQLLLQDILEALGFVVMPLHLELGHRLRSKKLMIKSHKIMYAHTH